MPRFLFNVGLLINVRLRLLNVKMHEKLLANLSYLNFLVLFVISDFVCIIKPIMHFLYSIVV
jgi:hypothetical protein